MTAVGTSQLHELCLKKAVLGRNHILILNVLIANVAFVTTAIHGLFKPRGVSVLHLKSSKTT